MLIFRDKLALGTRWCMTSTRRAVSPVRVDTPSSARTLTRYGLRAYAWRVILLVPPTTAAGSCIHCAYVSLVLIVRVARAHCCSHINSHNQVRGHRTGSSHSGVEEYPTGKTHTQPKVVHAYYKN